MGKIAVVSPSMAGPAYGPQIHDQAMARLRQLTGEEIVQYPTTSKLGASAAERAADLHAAFSDPEISAVMATVGGNDQITVLPHLQAQVITQNPKPFFGYSDNTHLHNWLWKHGVPSYYGGSTQVQIGPGPCVDEIHARSLLAALQGEDVVLTNPGESEDHGHDWDDPRALTSFGERQPVGSWQWAGADKVVRAATWGGCVQVLRDIFVAGSNPPDSQMDGKILLLEFSDDPVAPIDFGRFLRSLGQRGFLARFAAVMLARVPATSFGWEPSAEEQAAYREAMAELVVDAFAQYAPHAVVSLGVPFGHTRPQWILPYGGEVTLDPRAQTVTAHYRLPAQAGPR
ncbi:MAG: LD-carboxypeptidase [Actinomycetaceae bacterium]|nr:LD-carboxypeptidase [Actinomycetaceae bacterium]